MAKDAKLAKLSYSKILSIANNKFSNDLYQALYPHAKCSSGNLIFSPFSVYTALGMVGQGAEGDTRSKILQTLNLEDDENDVIGETYQEVIKGFPTEDSHQPFTLLTANKAYCETGFTPNHTFIDNLKKDFTLDLEQIRDLTSAADVRGMNEWVATATKEKIPDIFAPGSTNSPMHWQGILLANAIYFKGVWEYPFDAKRTSKTKFHVTPSKEVEVDMMRKDSTFAYRDLPKLKAHAVSLPYKGGRLSMIIVLPKAIDGLAEVQRNLGSLLQDGKSIVNRNWNTRASHRIIELSLPKFKIQAGAYLTQMLENMGCNIFSRDSDFSGIPNFPTSLGGMNYLDTDLVPVQLAIFTTKLKMFVADLGQKAFIEVNEKGAEAAAVTAAKLQIVKHRHVGVPVVSVMSIPFVVDHPFYFQIVDHENDDLILFAGHCNVPTN